MGISGIGGNAHLDPAACNADPHDAGGEPNATGSTNADRADATPAAGTDAAAFNSALLQHAGLRRLAHTLELEFDGHVLGAFEWRDAARLDPDAGWEAAITNHLVENYIDEITPKPLPSNAAAIAHAARRLDYLESGSEDAARRIAAIERALTEALADPELKLYSLESEGEGTFGVGNGFAVLDPRTGEALFAVSGYAE